MSDSTIILKHNRALTLSVGNSRKSIDWRPWNTDVAGLYTKLSTAVHGTEPQAEYFAMKKGQQDDLKDIGGFVGGAIQGSRRKAAAVVSRSVIALDMDTVPPYGWDAVMEKLQKYGKSFCVYGTRKDTPTAPRKRVVFPIARDVTPDEYEPCARRVAATLGIEMVDPTCFMLQQLMYWPSCSADVPYYFRFMDAPLLDPDELLKSYSNWRDQLEWPRVPGETDLNKYHKMAVKQGDPYEKPGLVGAFCRAWGDIPSVMDKFLPGVYAQTANDPNRYTYLGGSTTGGAVLYQDEKFLYSHHATDPCSNKLVNAFDLVRLHLFGDKDDNVQPGTPVTKLPSYLAMCDLVSSDARTTTLITKERHDQAVADFAEIAQQGAAAEEVPADDTTWMQKLEITPKTGKVKPTIDNILIILDGDPMLKGKFAMNKFASRGEILGTLPWSNERERRLWSDTDSNGLYWYLEKAYGITGRGNIDSALDIHSVTHAFNDVTDYLDGLHWDGVKRLDTLFVDFLGAEDSAYTRAVTHKAFTAAVARAEAPGSKFDNMLILCGPQGIGKSTILDKLSKGWFNDSMRTFEGKEASELLQGVWIVEIAELDAFRRTDVSRIKQSLSLRADRYRAAYGRNVKEIPRCCVFFGTCNQMEFLQDTTGNRRFWPVDVGRRKATLNVFRDLTDEVVDQIWAEAKTYYEKLRLLGDQSGEGLYLTGDVEQAAKAHQEEHREVNPWEGRIREFVETPVPDDWLQWPLDRRRDYWNAGVKGDYTLVQRDRICALEVWCELFNGNIRDVKPADRREINSVLSRLPGWEPHVFNYKQLYGSQRGFMKQSSLVTGGCKPL
ncbi:MAG: VapE domain-containing protein [Bilifractor sp.]